MSPTDSPSADEEQLVRFFCLEEEFNEILKWFKGKGHERSKSFDERLQLSITVRETANKEYLSGEMQGAMLASLSALHCVDFTEAEKKTHTADQKKSLHEAIVPILMDLCFVMLMRGDPYNSLRSADLGLETVQNLASMCKVHHKQRIEELLAKFLFRRGLAKGQKREFESAMKDLFDAVKLMPDDKDIRKAYANCTVAVDKEKGPEEMRWNGLLSNYPVAMQVSANGKHWKRDLKILAGEVKKGCTKDNFAACSMILVAPIIACLVPWAVVNYLAPYTLSR